MRATGSGSTAKIICRNVWKIFGPDPQRLRPKLDASADREEIQERTGHVIAVKDVSFQVNEGETFVVMGLSGSGKSTLVRCITRLIEPTSGEVRIDDRDVVGMTESELTELRRHRMSMVFQNFGLFSHRTVVDNVAFGLEVRGDNRGQRMLKAMEVLELVGLSGWEDNYPRELSGGMQQRVGLARAMAVDPEILVFDEPFSALDPLIRREMQDELLGLQSTMKKTMMFITHDFLEAIKMGDHIAVMKDGEIRQIGTPEEIVVAPADDYVRDFTEDVPRYKVLSAGTVMRARVSPATRARFAEGVRVAAGTKLDLLTDRIADTDSPLPVVDAEDRLVGEIDRGIVMQALSSGGGPDSTNGDCRAGCGWSTARALPPR